MLHITPEMARAGYEYLRTTLPFRRWNLPKASEIEFNITYANWYYGMCEHYKKSNRQFKLSLSNRRISTSHCLIETIAHEMCHMRQRMTRAYRPAYGHGKDFQKLAKSVCRYHGFNWDYF